MNINSLLSAIKSNNQRLSDGHLSYHAKDLIRRGMARDVYKVLQSVCTSTYIPSYIDELLDVCDTVSGWSGLNIAFVLCAMPYFGDKYSMYQIVNTRAVAPELRMASHQSLRRIQEYDREDDIDYSIIKLEVNRSDVYNRKTCENALGVESNVRHLLHLLTEDRDNCDSYNRVDHVPESNIVELVKDIMNMKLEEPDGIRISELQIFDL